MRTSTKLLGGASLALLATYYITSMRPADDADTATMQPDGVTETKGLGTQTRTVDWQVVLKSAVEKKTSLLTMTKIYDIQRDRELTQSIFKVEASNCRWRSKLPQL